MSARAASGNSIPGAIVIILSYYCFQPHSRRKSAHIRVILCRRRGAMKFRFLTSTPLDIVRGSGTFVGIQVLASALQKLGHTVDYESPTRHFSVYTLERLWFNYALRPSPGHD